MSRDVSARTTSVEEDTTKPPREMTENPRRVASAQTTSPSSPVRPRGHAVTSTRSHNSHARLMRALQNDMAQHQFVVSGETNGNQKNE